MTEDAMRETLVQISYKPGWTFRMEPDGPSYFLQILFDGEDSVTGEILTQHCRKWRVSQHMSKTEFVRTVYKAVEAAELHELQERFRYKGQAIYGPHTDVEALVGAARSKDHRADPDQGAAA